MISEEKYNEKRVRWIKIIINVACVAFLFISSITTVVASSYSIHQSDDFFDASNIIKFGEKYNSRVGMSIASSINEYMTHQGTWLCNFFRPLLMPLLRNGMETLKWVQILISMMILLALIIFFYIVPRYLFKYSHTMSIFVCSILMYMFASYKVYYEVFYWYTGIVGYGIPFIFGLLSFVFALIYVKDNKKIWIILACLFGFISTGGTLGQAGLMCYVALLAVIYVLLCKKVKISISLRKITDPLIYFGVILSGTMFNVIAPGNYQRMDAEMNLLGAIKNTFRVAYSEYVWLFKDTNIVLIILLLFSIGFCSKVVTSIKIPEYILASIIGLASPFVCIFPVVLGYGMPYVANRGIMIVNFAMYVSIANFSIAIGCWLRQIFNESEAKVFTSMTVMLMTVLLLSSNYSIKNVCFIKTAANIANGTIPGYHRDCCELFQMFEESEGQNIVLDSYPQPIDDFSCFFLENSWVNDGIAAYYGMDSLVYSGE